MCGIAGIIKFDPLASVAPERLHRMRDVLQHRGPDGAGIWTDGPVSLVHRRLSIVDLAAGAQPMLNASRSTCIVFNGEIYNHPELKRELEQRGHVYSTRCDTETILHVYDEAGERCVEQLRGMFAFAIWDRDARRLMLARDRLGIKPLYYAFGDDEILFASEIKAILAAGFRPALNRAILPEYLATGFVSGEETFFRGIRKLLPGRTMTWSADGGVQERRYWSIPQPARSASGTLAEQAADLRERLAEVVRGHLMSDVPVGLFLSGGIDSTGLGMLMAKVGGQQIDSFSVGFPNREANELDYARIAADAIGSNHHEITITGDQFFAELPRLLWHEDEPIAFSSSVPLYFVSALARERVKVVLTGEGADELFGGYNRYRVTALNYRLGSIFGQSVPAGARSLLRRRIASLPPRLRRFVGRSFLAMEADARTMFFENFAVFPAKIRDEVLPQRGDDSRDPFAQLLRSFEGTDGTMLDRMMHTDMQAYLVELLMKQDQMSMAASVESRVPFLDHELVEHVTQLPPSSKVRGWQTKVVLREALGDLIPKKIRYRRKMGFPVPLGHWFRGPFGGIIDELVLGARTAERGLLDAAAVRRLVEEHRSGRADHGARLWALVNLELWNRLMIDGEDHQSIAAAAGLWKAA